MDHLRGESAKKLAAQDALNVRDMDRNAGAKRFLQGDVKKLSDTLSFLLQQRQGLQQKISILRRQGCKNSFPTFQPVQPYGSMCPNSMYTLALKYLYIIGTTLRPKYILFGYMDP